MSDELQRRLVARIRALAKQKRIPLSHIPDRAGIGRSHFFAVMRFAASPTLKWVEKVAEVLAGC